MVIIMKTRNKLIIVSLLSLMLSFSIACGNSTSEQSQDDMVDTEHTTTTETDDYLDSDTSVSTEDDMFSDMDDAITDGSTDNNTGFVPSDNDTSVDENGNPITDTLDETGNVIGDVVDDIGDDIKDITDDITK